MCGVICIFLSGKCWLTSHWDASRAVQSGICVLLWMCSCSHCYDPLCLQDAPCSRWVWAVLILSVMPWKITVKELYIFKIMHAFMHMVCGNWGGDLGSLFLSVLGQNSLTGLVLQGKRWAAFPRGQGGGSYNLPCCSGLAKMSYLWIGLIGSQSGLEKCEMLLHLWCWRHSMMDVRTCEYKSLFNHSKQCVTRVDGGMRRPL